MGIWIYILKGADDSYCAGHTDNLDVRIAQHQSGEIPGYTTSRLPVSLVFSQDHSSREEALAAERQIKGWGRRKKEAMMRGDSAEVSRLARGRGRETAIHPSTNSGRTDSGNVAHSVRGEPVEPRTPDSTVHPSTLRRRSGQARSGRTGKE
jgi:predicted GIY-YIG superfamily endonuclease